MSLLRQIARRLYKSPFFRNVLVMMTGTVLAQILNLAFIPILSRLYDPATYGILGVYVSIAGIAFCASTLRYDLALMLPKEEDDAAGVFWLCVLAVTAVAFVVGIACLLFGGQIAALFKTPELSPWMWMIPITVFLMGVWKSLLSWSARRKQFHRTSISQVVRAASGPGTQVAAGVFGGPLWGLLLGSVVGDLCGVAAFAGQVFRRDWPLLRRTFQSSRLKRLAREYADFPMYSAPQTLMDTSSRQVPSLLLAYYFGTAVVGYYAFGVRIVQLPMQMVADALNSVLFQKASEVHYSGGNTYALFKKTTLGLIVFVTMPTVLVMLFAPAVAEWALGAEWRTAGEYSRWLVLWLVFTVCNIPAALFFRIFRLQRYSLLLDSSLLACRVLAIVIGGTFFTALQTIIIFTVVGIIFNVIPIAWIWIYFLRYPRASGKSFIPANI